MPIWNVAFRAKGAATTPAGNGVVSAGRDPLGRVDLCLVVDTTGSMGAFLRAAQERLVEAVSALATAEGDALDLHVGLVEYRDHPPQDRTFVTRAHRLTGDLAAVRRAIDGLRADGGGDHDEAVYDGLTVAAEQIGWRPHSLRFVLLVGDAPPHGARAHDGAGRPCACGATLHTVTAAMERAGVTVHALCVSRHAPTLEAFEAVARGTGGEAAFAHAAARAGAQGGVIEAMLDVLRRECGRLPQDRAALAVARRLGPDGFDTARVAESLGGTRADAAASLARLARRGLLDGIIPAAPAPAGAQ
jgi:hypothetical protein